jgi:glucose/arabinose dehydrogenase
VHVVIVLLAVICAFRSEASAQLRTQVIASGLTAPIAFVQDPNDRNTFFIAEQDGLVRTLVSGQLQGTPFIDLRPAVLSGGERGLLGMAFSPDGRVFFNFTNAGGHTVIARFRRDAASPRRADPATRFDLMWPSGERFIRQPFANHNGGHLEFGPDGMLYIGLGDGGSGNDPQNHAQNPASLLGKMLRIDVMVADSDPIGYRVPADNPFVEHHPIAARSEIWSFGLRNPWRYSFDSVGPGATGALFIADVGQSAREEINAEPFGAGGRNYGWRIREGLVATPGVPATPPAYEPLTNPIYEYGRTLGQAVTGGYVYRGTALGTAYQGRYFFADYVSGQVWSLGWTFAGDGIAAVNVVDHTAEIGTNLGGPASFGRDRDGELYLLTLSGSVLKVVGAAGAGPLPSAPGNLSATVAGQTVSLSWTPITGTAYQIEAGSLSGASNLAVITTNQSSALFPNVPPGTYFVRVRSVNGAGVSAASNEVVVSVGGTTACTQPLQPPELGDAHVSGRLVTLSWSATPDSSLQLRLEAGSRSGASDIAVVSLPSAQRVLMVSAAPGIYFVRMRLTDACGSSAPSREIVVNVF